MLASGPHTVARTVFPFSKVSPLAQNSSYATEYHIYVFREGSSFGPTSARSEVPCWQQQLECEWKTSQLWERSSIILSQLASGNVLAQPCVLFSVGLLRTKCQVPNFPFSNLWQHGKWKHNIAISDKIFFSHPKIACFCTNVFYRKRKAFCLRPFALHRHRVTTSWYFLVGLFSGGKWL